MEGKTVSTLMLRLPPSSLPMRAHTYTLLPRRASCHLRTSSPTTHSLSTRSLHTTSLLSSPPPFRRRSNFSRFRPSDSDEPSGAQFPRQRGGRRNQPPSSSSDSLFSSSISEQDNNNNTNSPETTIHAPTSPTVQALKEALPDEPYLDGGLNDVELAYFTAKAEAARGAPVDYNPVGLSLDNDSTFSDLADLRPELARSRAGMQETVEGRMRKLAERRVGEYVHERDLAFRLIKGRKILFESEAEKERVRKEAKELLERREYWREWRRLKKSNNSKTRGGRSGDGNRRAEVKVSVNEAMKGKKTVEDVEIERVDEDLKRLMLGRFVEGRYEMKMGAADKTDEEGTEEGSGILKQIQRMTALNGTYGVRDQRLFMEKVKGVLSFSSGGGSSTGAGSTVAAAGGGRRGAGNVRGAGAGAGAGGSKNRLKIRNVFAR